MFAQADAIQNSGVPVRENFAATFHSFLYQSWLAFALPTTTEHPTHEHEVQSPRSHHRSCTAVATPLSVLLPLSLEPLLLLLLLSSLLKLLLLPSPVHTCLCGGCCACFTCSPLPSPPPTPLLQMVLAPLRHRCATVTTCCTLSSHQRDNLPILRLKISH